MGQGGGRAQCARCYWFIKEGEDWELTIGFNTVEVNGDLEREGFGEEVGRKPD